MSSSPLRILFMGTPDFAVPSLKALLGGGDHLVGVLTQPDRVSGRGMQTKPSPVKRYAQQCGLPVYQPVSLRHPEAVSLVTGLKPDVIVVTAYGLLLPPSILAIPRHGCINVHASLLPRWRGAAPIQRAILAGDEVTGVTIMVMEEGLDTGPIVDMESVVIDETMTTGRLHDQLADLGGRLLATTIQALKLGNFHSRPQPEAGITYANKLKSEEEHIDWNSDAAVIHRQVRALSPRPGARTRYQGHTLKILEGSPCMVKTSAKPGEVIAIVEDGFQVACGSGVFLVKTMTPSGKKTMSATAWVLGRQGVLGHILGDVEKIGM
ncbi:MAG: methionyl-tRNA formyltransferase [Magnetococcales bacterium]|nr:methionyl-tRNA formyltransferase [Magnetococcales bacterium]